nr:CarD family transcriptional regulator [Treponema sp.]
MDKESTEFKVNQRVVYPSQGVGVINEIVDKKYLGNGELAGKIVKHYRIYLEVSDMVVTVPVTSAEKLGIRAIVTAEAAQKALDSLSIDNGPVTSDWKLRFQQNMELLKKGSVDDIANIVRCLYQRSKVKELPIQERKLYDSAKKLLIDEISFALGKEASLVEAMIHAKLEPLGASVAKKSIQNNFDDEDDDDDFSSDGENSNDSDDSDDADDDSDSDDSSDSNDEDDEDDED